jgi:Carboxypeptidase regulatory-like domain
MKQIAIVLALASACILPALADQNGGIAGTVVDAKTGQPMAHATLYYYKAPYLENGPNQIKTLQTNSRGFFADITLQPGRYVVMARFPNKVEGCAIDDVVGGETTHMRLEIGHDALMCSGPHIHPMTIDPNATADVYRI